MPAPTIFAWSTPTHLISLASSITFFRHLFHSSKPIKVSFLCLYHGTYLAQHMEKATAPHSGTLAWRIPWTEKPGRLQSMGSLRDGHDWATSLSLIGEGNGNPLQCSCLENPRDGGAWWAAACGVTHSQTRLKRLSSSRTKWDAVIFPPHTLNS